MTWDIKPILSVIIVTYNSSHVILDCVTSIASDTEVEVIVIDNASTDGTPLLIRTTYPQIRVICNSSNEGFARAVNVAAKMAAGDTLLLLNPDAKVSHEVVVSLLQHLNTDSRLAVVAPVLSDGKGEFRTVSAGLKPSVRHVFNHFAGLSRFSRRAPWLTGHYLLEQNIGREATSVDWVSGGCLMVKREDWEALGGLSERWFMYAEDIDFCLRLREMRRVVQLLPQLHATHAIGGSSSNVDGRVNTVWIENLFDLYCWRLSRSRADQEMWRLVVLAGFLGRAGAYGIRSMISSRARLDSSKQLRRYLKFAAALVSVKPTQNRKLLKLP